MQTILTIDDEMSIRESYRLILSGDYQVLSAENGQAGFDVLKTAYVDLILLDLTMPGMSGAEFLAELQARGETIPVIVVTASNTVTSAVETMKLGAREYMIKPFDVESLLLTVRRILTEERDRRELSLLRETDLSGFESLIGSSPAFQDVLTTAKKAMKVDSAVLITGESGTGKDLVARAIHSGGRRAQNAFVALSCCAIPQALLESELFGHEKGAFTGADRKRIGKLQVADGGTLFLDELGEMPLEAQVKLLRVLQDNRFYPVGSTKEIEVDMRVICATNRNLPECIADGSFRQDLFYRINVLPIEMPSLRQRREDIPELIAHFVVIHGPKVNARSRELTPAAMSKLAAYDWPGNVRELGNTIERLLVHFGEHEVINEHHVEALLPQAPREESDPGGRDGGNVLQSYEGLPLEEATSRMERHLIERALDRCGNNQSKAADALGTTRRKLKYKMDQLGMGIEQGVSAR